MHLHAGAPLRCLAFTPAHASADRCTTLVRLPGASVYQTGAMSKVLHSFPSYACQAEKLNSHGKKQEKSAKLGLFRGAHIGRLVMHVADQCQKDRLVLQAPGQRQVCLEAVI